MTVGELLTQLKERERELRQNSDEAAYEWKAEMQRKHADDVRQTISIVENELMKHTFRKVHEEAR